MLRGYPDTSGGAMPLDDADPIANYRPIRRGYPSGGHIPFWNLAFADEGPACTEPTPIPEDLRVELREWCRDARVQFPAGVHPLGRHSLTSLPYTGNSDSRRYLHYGRKSGRGRNVVCRAQKAQGQALSAGQPNRWSRGPVDMNIDCPSLSQGQGGLGGSAWPRRKASRGSADQRAPGRRSGCYGPGL